ncbi:glycosyltransferase, partial [Pseudomonas viridiflava]
KNLDYPDYEVLVIDNNTQEQAVWKPVEQACQRLGKRFRFFHVEAMPGYKAGALNYLMERTAPDVKVIAVVDADYCVDRNWLRHMAPHFEAPNIAVIQA